jgi:hypothetical protein
MDGWIIRPRRSCGFQAEKTRGGLNVWAPKQPRLGLGLGRVGITLGSEVEEPTRQLRFT